jgi:ubiquinol-cytochrome c reductase cytochrome c subunit
MRRLLLIGGAVAAIFVAGPSSALAPQGDAARGKTLYGRYCLACHGDNGGGVTSPRQVGAGPLRAQTTQRALGPSLRGVGALAADFYLRTGYMPLQKVGVQPRRQRLVLDGGQIDDLVSYVASLGIGPAVPQPHPERGNLSEGQRSFTEHCAGCHQIVGEGGYVTGGIPPSLDEATPTQIAEAVRIGPYVMPRFSRRAISDRELDSLIRYVEYAKHPDDRGGWAIGHLGPVPEGLVTWFIGAAALVLVCLVIGRRLHR